VVARPCMCQFGWLRGRLPAPGALHPAGSPGWHAVGAWAPHGARRPRARQRAPTQLSPSAARSAARRGDGLVRVRRAAAAVCELPARARAGLHLLRRVRRRVPARARDPAPAARLGCRLHHFRRAHLPASAPRRCKQRCAGQALRHPRLRSALQAARLRDCDAAACAEACGRPGQPCLLHVGPRSAPPHLAACNASSSQSGYARSRCLIQTIRRITARRPGRAVRRLHRAAGMAGGARGGGGRRGRGRRCAGRRGRLPGPERVRDLAARARALAPRPLRPGRAEPPGARPGGAPPSANLHRPASIRRVTQSELTMHVPMPSCFWRACVCSWRRRTFLALVCKVTTYPLS